MAIILHDIYMNTDFVVYDLILKIGKSNPEFDKILFERDAKSWAIITWHNPNAKKMDDEFNESNHRHLHSELARNFQVHAAEGRGRDWSEASWLVLNISKKDALWFAGVGQQVAFVYGVTGEAPELVYVDI